MTDTEDKSAGDVQATQQDKSADKTESEFMESYYTLTTEEASKDVKGYSKA